MGKLNLILRHSLVFAFLLTQAGCGSGADSEDSSNSPTALHTCSGSELTALESKMQAALQSVATDHSFYMELQRPGIDTRKFTHARNIDGAVTANTTLNSA